MKFLNYIQLANAQQGQKPKAEQFSIALVSNFTDDVLAKVLTGVCLHNGLPVELYKAPYKQYAFLLKDRNSQLWQRPSRLTFFFFDLNFYVNSEFSSAPDAGRELINDLEIYASSIPGTIVINTFLLPYHGPSGNRVVDHELFLLANTLNRALYDMAQKHSNVEIFDINRLAFAQGEKNTRDMRGLYAFDTPFTNDFLTLLAQEWFVYIRALTGKAKKVIVLDLDNTLWGGVVGELGPEGIALGPGYPGLAFQNFQRALLEYYKAGILLAINSKNNPGDVEEVFKKNRHMVLTKAHFASTFINWEDKVTNLRNIAKELNLGLESFIFLDDDPLQREMVKSHLPEVLVPEFSASPEDYSKILYQLPVFSPFAATGEDADKNKKYAEERKRQELQNSVVDLSSFIAKLAMVMELGVNNRFHIPRISQLTLKTNQFNVTTKRYTEKDIAGFMERGFVFNAGLTDKFGDYGLTALAIILKDKTQKGLADLDSLLMSCRILGRGAEFAFLDRVIREMEQKQGLLILRAKFIASLKNQPAKSFFKDFGFTEVNPGKDGAVSYELDCKKYCAAENPKVYGSIKVKLSQN